MIVETTQQESLFEMNSEDQRHNITIYGQLPGGKQLIAPIVIQVQYDDDEVLVSETRCNLFATGATIQEAIIYFKRIMAEEFSELTRDDEEDLLSPRLQKHLQYLRSIIH